MAAAEARGAWQRAANRCVVQEDRKRTPKLACCPLSSEQQHGKTNGNFTSTEDRPISSFVPLSCNPINTMPQDVRWWLQSHQSFGMQKDLANVQRYLSGREICEKEMEDSGPKPDEPLHSQMIDTNYEKGEDVFEPTWMISTAVMRHSSETGPEELNTIGGYSQVPLKCRGNASISGCLYEDKHFVDSKKFGSQPSGISQKANCDMEASRKKGGNAQPWWQITDENELASLVAEKAMQHIENCGLPRPAQTVCVHGTEPHNHENMSEYAGPSSSAGMVSHSYPGQYEHIQFSHSSPDELDLFNDGVRQRYERNSTYRNSHIEPEGKEPFLNPSERAQLLEALRRSQTRARKAEMAAKEAYNQKEDVIKLLLQQAYHLFACKQWLKTLQLESICLQLKHKHKGHHFLILELPWMALKEKLPVPGQEGKNWTKRKGRRHKKTCIFCDAILFAVGLGLTGAGLLLGWTLGWLLPTL